MSIGPMNLPAAVAGSPLAQTKGTETDRAAQESTSLERHLRSEQLADKAAGIGATDGEDTRPNDRDADGRRPWEFPPQAGTPPESTPEEAPHAVDPTGQSGSQLDLSG